MDKRHWFASIAAALGIVVLIMDSKTAFLAADEGINLCLHMIIPSLYPFMILTTVLIQNSYGTEAHIQDWITSCFHVPKGMGAYIIPSFLGGYPIGAQGIYNAYKSNMISKQDAERLLGHCSNAGPSFVIGVLSHHFSGLKPLLLIWIIQILSAVLTAHLVHPPILLMQNNPPESPAERDLLAASINSLAKICAWIILFRIIIRFLQKWILWILPREVSTLFCGILELSNGCSLMNEFTDEHIRFIAANAILAFGGICVIFQTASICAELNMKYYILGKILQSIIAGLLAAGLVFTSWHLLLPVIGALVFLALFREKRVAFCSPA